MGGMPGMGGGAKKSKGKAQGQGKSKKGRSGNPAKRADQEAGLSVAATITSGPGSMLGIGGSGPAENTAALELPDELKRLLG